MKKEVNCDRNCKSFDANINYWQFPACLEVSARCRSASYKLIAGVVRKVIEDYDEGEKNATKSLENRAEAKRCLAPDKKEV